MAALEELAVYATEVILPDLELALTDPSPEVRNAALRICESRRLLACVDEAEQMWADGESSVRMMALAMLSRDPSPAHLEIIYEAMRDPNDLVREHALTVLVDAPLTVEGSAEARKEIVAQLGDVSARVRKTAARSLGRLGPGEGALALVRLLEDIDLNVAEAAAHGLGQLADPRTAPALRRALESPNNPNFAAAAVLSLARLPGEDIDLTLLEILDTPPRNTRRPDVARAIGQRPMPSDALIAGLVERMRDPDLRTATSNALLWMGDLAVPRLEAALLQGLEPDIAIEVGRLLDARKLVPTPRDGEAVEVGRLLRRPAPRIDDREAWFERLDENDALDEAAVLAAASPSWLSGALAWHLDRAASVDQARNWLVALVLAAEPLLESPDHALIWGKVAQWAGDSGGATSDRCLATLALGRAAETRHRGQVHTELELLAGAHLAEVRGCAAMSLARMGGDPLLAALLADPSPRVRAMAALAHGLIRRPSDEVQTQLALQADSDSESRARTSAAFAIGQRGLAGVGFVLLRPPVSNLVLGGVSQWQRFEIEGQPVDVPMFRGGFGGGFGVGSGDQRWAIAPLQGAVAVEVDVGEMVVPSISPYYYEGYGH